MCSNCNEKPTRNEALHKTIRDIYRVAKKHGWKEVAVVERANSSGYMVVEASDERTTRLNVICYHTID